MKYHSMIPELTISDIEITKDFYLNKLGSVSYTHLTLPTN